MFIAERERGVRETHTEGDTQSCLKSAIFPVVKTGMEIQPCPVMLLGGSIK